MEEVIKITLSAGTVIFILGIASARAYRKQAIEKGRLERFTMEKFRINKDPSVKTSNAMAAGGEGNISTRREDLATAGNNPR